MFNTELKRPFQYEKISLQTTSKEKSERATNTAKTIRRLFSYVMTYKWKLILVIFMVIISSSFGLLGPYLVGTAIDDFIVTKKATGLLYLLGALVIVYTVHALAIFLQNFWMIDIAQQTVYTLRHELFEQFHRLPIVFFDRRQQGELMSRVTNDIDNINNTLNESVIQIFTSLITLIGTVAVMLYLSPLLTAITMLIIPLLFIAMRWITRRTGALYKRQQYDLGELNGYIEETVSGQQLVKTFSQEKRVIDEFAVRNETLQLSNFWAQTIAGYIPKVMNSLNLLSFTLIAFFGGLLALNGHITVGVIVIFTEYARQFTRPLNELSNQFNILLSAVAGAERVFHILDEKVEASDEMSARDLPEIRGNFTFTNVQFAYKKGEPVLKNIHLDVKAGQTVAFVGHTGAGKTTMINLLSRFYPYDDGSITVDGIELASIKRENLRKQMAFVLQDTFIFQATVRENIRYGKLTATDEEVIVAAKRANAHTFIERLPNGYDTLLEENGSNISQGQKQLIAIARAMIRDPAVLILDEATSNIDTITEVHIQEALKRLMKGRTSFVIAHRLNTIREADMIVLLENGEIIEKGTHKQLMDAKGKYYSLHEGIV